MLAIKWNPRVCEMEKEKLTLYCVEITRSNCVYFVLVRGCGCACVCLFRMCIRHTNTLAHIAEKHRIRCVYNIYKLRLSFASLCMCVCVFCFHSSAGICERHLTVCASVVHVYAFLCVVGPIVCRLLLLLLISFHFNLLCMSSAWWVQAAHRTPICCSLFLYS